MLEVLEVFDHLSKEAQSSSSNTWKRFQNQAWKRLCEIGLPTRKHEAFQYVSLTKLYEKFKEPQSNSAIGKEIGVSSHILPECQNSYLVFVEGKYCPELSMVPSDLVVMDLEEGLDNSYGAFLKHRLHSLIEKETDPWALLNGCLNVGGVCIYVPPSKQFDSALQIIDIQTDPNLSYRGSRSHIFVGAGSSLEVISSDSTPLNAKTLINDFMDVFLEENARFYHVVSNETQNDAWGFNALRAGLKKNSLLRSTAISLSSQSYRRDYRVSLLGEGAEADLKGLTALSGKAQSHVNIYMDHSAPSCVSRQYFKNVLADKSVSSFTGKIYVQREAQKTEAYQLNQNLLLSDHATANSKPNLEIFADDVKASHGATVTQLDDEQLLYLRTRGIGQAQAKALMVAGFCQEIIQEISQESLRSVLVEQCGHEILQEV